MLYYLTLILAITPMAVDLDAPSPDLNFKISSQEEQLTRATALTVFRAVIEQQMSLGCDLNVYLDEGTIAPGFYQAMNQIIATEVVPAGNVIFRAGEEVLLENGFEVQIGATLEVEMGECIL